ncbi:aminoacylase-1-like isoform X2 [Hyposmocoma kahamanoa]|uniref:aminoacylase-1-like isoform X2 n=1 Tax=Hyposmocoma kahamanoa TaxID=1477025 RepID=UPI000E6D947F|nr:aminoacylase-1-like isoform X2 [Hyposmocoma kahamanoa]
MVLHRQKQFEAEQSASRERYTMAAKYANNSAIQNFIEYLKIPSVQPDVNYDECVNFLKKQAASLALPIKVYEVVPHKPIVVLKWEGIEPKLPSILLNSHMDVVPVFEKSWTYPPFSGHIDEDGKIFARGSQDMKCVGMQYLEAIRKLKQRGVQLQRTVYICFVPDEEIGGHDGMKKFVHTSDFKALNVGFALDEGMASPNEEFIIFNGERSIWQIHVHCPGRPGHGSLLLPDTAGEKLRYVINKFMDLIEQQKKILDSDSKLTIGDVTTVNLTQIYGGVQSNVIPEKLTVVFDIRLAVTVDHNKFESMIKQWCKEAGDGVTYEFEQFNEKVECTKTDNTNPYWVAFKSAVDNLNLKLDRRIFPGGTDSRYVRQVGIPAIGFSPMNNTPVLLHDHDEFLEADVFLRGIDIYEKIIAAVANA